MEHEKTFTLINYFDVWGDSEYGWVVNNQCVEADDVYISDDSTDKEICEYLRKTGYLTSSDMRKLAVSDWGDLIEINERKSGMPLFAFIRNNY